MSRLVIVSNRVPVPSERGAKAGGLAVAMADAMTPGSVWFGWSGRRQQVTSETAKVAVHGDITYATIDLGEAAYQGFYVGFANSALWPLLHYRTGLLDFRRADYNCYLEVNRAYARALAPLLKPDDLVWVHDYQLLTLPAELRRLGIKNRIGFFLHIPFVPPAILHVLPPAAELLDAMAAADIIGFQTDGDRVNFVDAVTTTLQCEEHQDNHFTYQGRKVRTVVVPIGIDTAGFSKTAKRAVKGAQTKRLCESLGNRSLVIGVDRLDYSKGLPQRFESFGQFLRRHPEHLRDISFLQIAAPSREDVDRYQALRRELDRKAGDINGEFSDFDWTPLRYMTRAVNRTTIAGFYQIARIALVTPLRDGMNLVAKEFIAAQDENDPGVLVLSRFAGAAEEMTEALIVNPYDTDAVADAMHQALTMSLDERRERHDVLLKKIRQNTAASFCRIFIDYLSGAKPVP